MPETLVILKDRDVPDIHTLSVFRKHGGYEALAKALKTMTPDEVTQEVMTSGLRGRGGAGFPTGRKWSFLAKNGQDRYLVCNADEGEPGTFKDHEILETKPHMLVEGMALAGYALGSHQGFIYCRGEFKKAAERLNEAIAEAKAANLLGDDILGSGFSFNLTVYRGAGAYICGEETALLDSLEGKRGIPRLKPPFPAVAGLYGKPTIVNNVETLAAVGPIIEHGGKWFASMGTEKSTGTRVFSISGQVRKPGNYELTLDTTLGQLIEEAGGLLPGRKLKAVIPGGASAPLLTEAHLGIPMDFEAIAAAGSMAGSGGVIVMDDTVCMVDLSLRCMSFYAHESCGKCTPCREGTGWLEQVLHRMEHGEGRLEDLAVLTDAPGNIVGRTFCALGDASCGVLESALKLFPEEFQAHIDQKGCPFKKEVAVW